MAETSKLHQAAKKQNLSVKRAFSQLHEVSPKICIEGINLYAARPIYNNMASTIFSIKYNFAKKVHDAQLIKVIQP